MRKKGLSEFVESPQARRLSRRKFLTRLGLGSFTLTVGSFFTSIGAYILPKMNFEPSASFTIGRPEEYRVGEMKLLEARQIYIFRTPLGFQAVSGICTHLGCAYNPYGPPNERYDIVHALCPCHGSIFARDGQVLAGPAPRPLPFYHLSRSPSGLLVVDKSIYEPTDELSRASGEGIGHNLYFDPELGQLVEGPLPKGEDLRWG
jgi:cytochrome b6-f complex iron-sulfur subunit